MKIQCDVCEKAAASVICCADEAALCAACDVEVHAANKVASKHQRLCLEGGCLPNKLPRCDICQEKAAFIFCLEDRALFCRDCDESIHVAGTLSGAHRRYLATGIRVSLDSICNEELDRSVQQEQHKTNPPPPPVTEPKFLPLPPPAPTTQTNEANSPFSPVWAVDEFLQLSPDYSYSSDKLQEPDVSFGELEWFSDAGFVQDQMPKKSGGLISAAARVPEMNHALGSSTNSSAFFYRAGKSSGPPIKKARVDMSAEEEFFLVPDLG